MANSETKIVITAQDATKGAFDSVKGNLGALKSSLSGLSLGSLGAVGLGGFTAADFIAKTMATLDNAEAINKLSQKTGIAADTLSGFRVAAELADVSQETLGTGLKKLAVNMAAAAGGGKEQADVFEAMGIKVKDATGKLRATDDMLRDISDKFAAYKDGPAKAALAVQLFGKSGDALIPLLNNLRETETEAQKLGAVFGPDFAKRAEEFNDNLKKMGIAAEGAKIKIISPLLEGLKEITKEMVENTEEGNRWVAMLKAGAQALGFMDTKKLAAQKELAGIPDQIAGLEANAARLDAKGPAWAGQAAAERDRIRQLRARGEYLIADINDYGKPRAANGEKTDAPIVNRLAADESAAKELARLREIDRKGYIEGLQSELDETDNFYKDTAKLTEVNYKALEKLRQEDLKGLLAGIEAQTEASDEMYRELGKIQDEKNKQANKTSEIGKELGLTFASAFEDAVVKGNDFRTVLKGIEQDIARIIARKAITEPLGEAVGGLFKGSGGFGSIFSGLFGGSPSSGSWTSGGDLPLGSYATGTDFVPQTGLYRLHRGEKVTPADQNGGGAPVINMNIIANDARSFAQMMATAEGKAMIGAIVNQAYTRGGRRSGMTL